MTLKQKKLLNKIIKEEVSKILLEKSSIEVFSGIKRGPLASSLRASISDIIETFRDKNIPEEEIRMVSNTYLMDFIEQLINDALR